MRPALSCLFHIAFESQIDEILREIRAETSLMRWPNKTTPPCGRHGAKDEPSGPAGVSVVKHRGGINRTSRRRPQHTSAAQKQKQVNFTWGQPSTVWQPLCCAVSLFWFAVCCTAAAETAVTLGQVIWKKKKQVALRWNILRGHQGEFSLFWALWKNKISHLFAFLGCRTQRWVSKDSSLSISDQKWKVDRFECINKISIRNVNEAFVQPHLATCCSFTAATQQTPKERVAECKDGGI